MSTTWGKVEVTDPAKIGNEKVLVLRFIQGRNPDWVRRPFFAKYDENAIWLDELKPAFGENSSLRMKHNILHLLIGLKIWSNSSEKCLTIYKRIHMKFLNVRKIKSRLLQNYHNVATIALTIIVNFIRVYCLTWLICELKKSKT